MIIDNDLVFIIDLMFCYQILNSDLIDYQCHCSCTCVIYTKGIIDLLGGGGLYTLDYLIC